MAHTRRSAVRSLAQSSLLPVLSLALVGLPASCRCAHLGTDEAKQTSGAASDRGACGREGSSAASAPTASDAVARASAEAADATVEAAPPLPPLDVPDDYAALGVEGFRDAVVSIPVGATEPRPVVVALHGNFDRPEWQCEVWRGITDGYPFVLCPRGVPRTDAPKKWDRWTYGALAKVQAELFAGLEALEQAFPQYVDDGPVVFTGFSLGAILGRYIIRKHGDRFPRAVLTEGGNKGWNALARDYRKSGGQRVLFGCAQSVCVQTARAAARHAERAELVARVADAGNVGHTYDGPVAAAVKHKWGWVVAGDSRWPGAEPAESDAEAADGGAADGNADGGAADGSVDASAPE